MLNMSDVKHKIDCEYACFCWFEFDTSEEVTQSCMYHKGRLLMRSDTKKDFANTKAKPVELSKVPIKK